MHSPPTVCACASDAHPATGRRFCSSELAERRVSRASPDKVHSRASSPAAALVIVPVVLATITAYNVGLAIHVLAVVLAFGPTFGYGFFIGFADNRAPLAVPAVNRAVRLTNLFLV